MNRESTSSFLGHAKTLLQAVEQRHLMLRRSSAWIVKRQQGHRDRLCSA
jgi:hypothetical protein